MNSVYKSMNESAALVPEGVRAKLLVRHSIRPGLEGQKIEYEGKEISIQPGFHWGLTREGEYFARALGNTMAQDFSIQSIHSSPSRRCMQTMECLKQGYLDGVNISGYLATKEEQNLAGFWIQDSKAWHKSYKAYNEDIKHILQLMLDGVEIEGAYPIEEAIVRLLETLHLMAKEALACGLADSDAVDSDLTDSWQLPLHALLSKRGDDNKCDKFGCPQGTRGLDVYVSHDGILMLFLCYVLGKRIEEIEWVYMLEGVFLWSEETTLCIAWRGEKFEYDMRRLVCDF